MLSYTPSRRVRRSKKIKPVIALRLTGMIWAGAGAAILAVMLLNAVLSPFFPV